MSNFSEVKPEDFTTFSPKPAPHILIENELIKIGGTGAVGISFKSEVLKLAGWKYGDLSSYGRNPELASEAFNRVRQAIAKTDNKEQLLDTVRALST
jgi:hypothetical protein